MSVTILAVLFIVVMLLLTAFGFKAIMQRGSPSISLLEERCTLCRKVYPKANLIERQVGDTRLYFFCRSCVNQLQLEMTQRNPST